MERDKVITISSWTRTLLLTLSLWLSFQMGLLSHIAPDSTIHGTNALSALIAVYLLVWVAPNSLDKLTGDVWNKITPVKNKVTFIESEIVYILSALFGITLFSAIFLRIGLKDIPTIAPVILLAALPGSICTYVLQRCNKKTMLAPHKDIMIEDSVDDVEPRGFDTSSLSILAYLAASSIFALFLAISVCIIIFLRVGPEPDKLIPIVTSIFFVCGSTALLLTVFGHVVMPVGVKIKMKLNMIPSETRAGIASTWFLGFMTITTIFITICGGVRPPTSIDIMLASWHLWVTYILFGISSYVGGLALKSFYKSKPISTAFV